MVILGIDTSCDDTGIGVVRSGEVLSSVVASQTALHEPYGGVLPEAASREHLRVIRTVKRQALLEAGVEPHEVELVAATRGPGLVGALLVGLNFGKALAFALDVPFLGINHLEGHIASSVVGGTLEPPFLALIASGGHTSLFRVAAWGSYEELGRTRDDAAGEAFDKVARQLGLPYPGGAALSQLAADGDAGALQLPRPLLGQAGYDFSFSGLKTAVATLLDRQPDAAPADVAAAFQEVVVDALQRTVRRAVEATSIRQVSVAGGVAANDRLREVMLAEPYGVHFPPLSLSADNGAMIALAADHLLRSGSRSLTEEQFGLDALPYFPLAGDGSGASGGRQLPGRVHVGSEAGV